MRRIRWPAVVWVTVTVGMLASCGGSSSDRSAGFVDVQRAIDTTSNASSFMMTTAGVEVIFHAPDTAQQVEHGKSESRSGDGSVTRGQNVITKVFIGERYYESNSE